MGSLDKLLDTGGDLSFELLIVCIIVGVSIAIVISLFNSKYAGDIVRKLYSVKANSPDNAMSLTEMGVKRRFWYTFALRKGGSLRKYVCIANEDELQKGRVEVKKAKLYLPAEKTEKALVIYGDKAPNLLYVAAAAAALFAAIILAAMAVPAIISVLTAV